MAKLNVELKKNVIKGKKLPFVILSQNTILRPLLFEDKALLSESIKVSLNNLKMWIPWAEYAPKQEDYESIALDFYQDEVDGAAIHFTAFHNENFMGMLSLYNIDKVEKSADLGLWFRDEYPAVAYFFEGIKAFIRYSFENIGLKSLEMPIVMGNFISEKVAKEVGFKLLRVDFHKDRQIKRYVLRNNEYRYDTEVKIVYKND